MLAPRRHLERDGWGRLRFRAAYPDLHTAYGLPPVYEWYEYGPTRTRTLSSGGPGWYSVVQLEYLCVRIVFQLMNVDGGFSCSIHERGGAGLACFNARSDLDTASCFSERFGPQSWLCRSSPRFLT